MRDRRLLELKGRATISVRLNRLFQADGATGIREFQRMARHYGSLGLRGHRPGALPPGARAERRHRRLARLRAPGGARVRPEPARDRAADHQRGQHRLLARTPPTAPTRTRSRRSCAACRRPSARRAGAATTSSRPGSTTPGASATGDADFWREVGAARRQAPAPGDRLDRPRRLPGDLRPAERSRTPATALLEAVAQTARVLHAARRLRAPGSRSASTSSAIRPARGAARRPRPRR